MEEQVKKIKSIFWLRLVLHIISVSISVMGVDIWASAGLFLVFYIFPYFCSYKIYKTFSITSGNTLITKYWWYDFWLQVAGIISLILVTSVPYTAAGVVFLLISGLLLYPINIALYNEVSKVTKNKLFFIGSILTIVFGVGLLLILIAFITFDKIYTMEELKNT